MRILIAGAGVAGGVIARELCRHPDCDVIIIEQAAADDHATAGNGLNIGPNAIKALRIHAPDVATELEAASLPWTRWKASLVDGTPLYEIPLAAVAENGGIRIRWSDLYRILQQAVSSRALFNRRCLAVRYTSAAKLAATIENRLDGTTDEIGDIDLVVAGDGRYSRIRQCLAAPVAIRHIGISNFRLLIEDGGESGIGDLEEWYSGPRRLLAFRLIDGRVYLSGNIPIAPGGEIDDELKSASGIRGAYLSGHAASLDVCQMLVEAACRQVMDLHWSRAQEISTAFRDGVGHAVFVGDSAHAMVPTLGQGATQALEDACAFVALFRKMLAAGPSHIPGFSAAFDRLRRARIDFVKTFSWEASAALLLGGDPVRDNAHKSERSYREKLHRLYVDVPFTTQVVSA